MEAKIVVVIENNERTGEDVRPVACFRRGPLWHQVRMPLPVMGQELDSPRWHLWHGNGSRCSR
jgi:hypothetical protein